MRAAGVASISSSSASRSPSGVLGGGLMKSGVQAPRRWSARRTVMSRSATRSRVAATHGRCSDRASGWSSVRTLLWSSISGEIAKRRLATSSGPKRKRIIQLSLNLLAPAEGRPQPVAMTEDRHLSWDGCVNVRDLGGLPAAGGRTVRRGAIVRADALDRLSADGWAALEAHGVRTVIDLRDDDELGADAAPRPGALTTLHLSLDGVEDTEFWKDWHGRPEFGTPHYYGPWLEHFPERAARVLAAIARAEPGGVAYHCGIGRDRTGLITMLLLAALGVPHDLIAEDYALSEGRVPPSPELDAFWAAHPSTPAEVLAGVLAAVDPEAYLDPADLEALRPRALSAAGRPSRPAGATPRPAR